MRERLSHRAFESSLARLEREFPQVLVELPAGREDPARVVRVAVRECAVHDAGGAYVLLHGISSGAASWLDCALALASRPDAAAARVLAWDAPGYGASTPLQADAPTVGDYVERLGQALDALNVRRCVLVGHSLGALVAAAYARRHGAARVSRVVLISPAGGYGGAAQGCSREETRRASGETRGRHEAVRRQREAVRRQRLGDLTELGIEGLADRAAKRLLSEAADPSARQWVRWNAARLDPAGYRQAVEMLCNSDLASGGPLAMPVSVHCGDADRVTPPADCADRARLFGTSLSLITRAGHASPVEQPRAVAEAIAVAALRSASADIDHRPDRP